MHALQGDGEIAGHTCDVAGTVTMSACWKGLNNEGPIFSRSLRICPTWRARHPGGESLSEGAGSALRPDGLEESLPISIIGTGPDLNAATDNG